jgi:hypothetical protein
MNRLRRLRADQDLTRSHVERSSRERTNGIPECDCEAVAIEWTKHRLNDLSRTD